YAFATYSIANHSHIAGRFTIAADQALQVQHRCTDTKETNGFGIPANFADEIYTLAEFWREIEPE
ncbi:unnamed protein product, partial [marine sediment metagenome]